MSSKQQRVGHGPANSLEESICSMKLRENIDDVSKSGFYNPQPQPLQLSAERGVLKIDWYHAVGVICVQDAGGKMNSKWDEMDGNAIANLHLALADGVLSSIEEKKRAKEIWDHLARLYEARNNKIDTTKKFLSETLCSSHDNSQERAEILLQSLPDSYDQVIINLTSNVLSDYLVFDDAAAAILEEENRCNNREDRQTSSRQVEALVVTRGRSMEPGSSGSHNQRGMSLHLKKLSNALCCEAAIANESRKRFANVNKAQGAQIHWGSLFGKIIMSSETSTVTYTFVYIDSEPGRAFWGADDEEICEGGIPWVIVLGYDGLPMQPVALPSPDYIPGPEDPQTPLVPQDEDEREPMFVQAHVYTLTTFLRTIYLSIFNIGGMSLSFQLSTQPILPVDSPTAESPGYVTESDPEEDPEEYEDDETEDGPVDYPMDGGDDGDDDDGDSSRDDANDEDEDDEDEEEEEEEHLAPADSAIVVPVDEPVFPPEGTEPVIPPPSTDITIGARITIRPQASISLPPEAEVERLLAMTTPSPSPPISLSPPSAGERLARCMALPAHSSPLLPSSGCPTQIQTLRITSTQALIDAVTAALPLPPLPPSLYIPPPVDRRDDIPESEQPPRKRLYLSTLGSRYEVGESSTARPTRGRGIDYGFVSMVDAKERRQGIKDTWVDPAEAVLEIAPMTVGEVNTRVT
ncbi:hypothetical protein Tco_0665202, partial [Tanacetum coccineum]